MILATEPSGPVAYLRSPLPLLFSDVIAEAVAEGTPLATPFLYPETTGTGVRYRVSLAAVEADPDALRARLARAFRWGQKGTPVKIEVTAMRLLARDPGRGFGSAEEARAALAGPWASLDPIFGDAVIEVAYRLDLPDPRGPVAVRPGLPKLELPTGVTLDTHMLDARAR